MSWLRQHLSVSALSCLIVVVVSSVLAFKSIGRLQSQIATRQESVDAAEANVAAVTGGSGLISQLKDQLATAASALPSGPGQDEALVMLQDALGQSGVGVTQVKIETADSTANQVVLTAQAQGSLAQLETLFKALAANPRPMIIRTLKITTADSGQLNLNLEVGLPYLPSQK